MMGAYTRASYDDASCARLCRASSRAPAKSPVLKARLTLESSGGLESVSAISQRCLQPPAVRTATALPKLTLTLPQALRLFSCEQLQRKEGFQLQRCQARQFCSGRLSRSRALQNRTCLQLCERAAGPSAESRALTACGWPRHG